MEGLHNPSGCSGGLTFLLLFQLALGRQHQDGCVLRAGQSPQLSDKRDAVHDGHIQVGNDNFDPILLQLLKAILAVAPLQDREARLLQGVGNHLPYG